ncbi:MAG: carboxypeptidase regulatory-like domain-containing protein [Bryobacteraceae bacterium]
MRAPFWMLFLLGGAVSSAQLGHVSIMQQPGQQATGKGVIEGTVVNAITQQPVKKAQVMLQGNANLSASTDATGHFMFKDLPEGSFMLQANASGYGGFRSRRRASAGTVQQVKLEADAKISDITIALTPNSSIAGRILDEDGAPLPGCQAMLMQYEESQGARRLEQRNNAQSDENGDYTFAGVQPGKYFVMCNCFQSRPLPHAFVERGPNMDVPTQTYATLFYPGGADLTGATQIKVAAGAEASGINFRMHPIAAMTVRGHVSAPESAANIQVNLHARDPQLAQAIQYGAQVEQAGKFQFRNVAPGSYNLEAFAMPSNGIEHMLYTKVPVEVGTTQLDRIEITLSPGATITGSIAVEGDAETPIQIENLQINMFPAEPQNYPWQQGTPKVQKDGTFTIAGIFPGKWRFFVAGLPGYLKSTMWNDEDLPGADLDVGSSGGKLKIVVGTKWAQLDGSATGDAGADETLNVLVWTDDISQWQTGNRTTNLDDKRHFQMGNMAPGKYHGCAVADPQPWALIQNEAALKKLAGRCEAFELTEGGQTTVQLPVVSATDIETLLQEQ